MNQSLDTKQTAIVNAIFDFYNENLFDNKLPKVFFAFGVSRGFALGFYAPKRLRTKDQKEMSIISLNPDFFGRTTEAILSTLAHEMCHHWQFEFGKPSRNGYHNRSWGFRMEEIGLMPSNTGKENGKKTGQQMTHYIIKDGKFDVLTRDFISLNKEIFLLDGMNIPESAETEKKKRVKNKIKYSCECSNIWGKPGLNIKCDDCGEYFEEQ